MPPYIDDTTEKRPIRALTQMARLADMGLAAGVGKMRIVVFAGTLRDEIMGLVVVEGREIVVACMVVGVKG